MRFLAALVASTTILTMAGVAQGHDVTYESTVTISYGEGTSRAITQFFKGDVTSGKKACRGGRTVKVFHQVEGPDQLVGSVTTEPDGHWSLGNDIAQGRHYAKVVRRDIGPSLHDHLCKGDRSPVIVV